MRVVTLPGVLRPPSDCRLLVEVMRDRRMASGARVLDVFTGSGAMGVAAALQAARAVTATDISRRATLNARINARLNGVRVRVLRGDLFAPVGAERFDLIVANPPYLPSARAEVPARRAARAWDGGLDGRAVLDRLCAEVGDHLAPRGSALIVQSSLAGERATLEALAGTGLEAETLERRRGPLGPIAAARAELLERRGILAPGEHEEELIIVRASAPA